MNQEEREVRAGRGFVALRKRFAQRASFLAQDADYQHTVESARAQWNTRFPQYEILPQPHKMRTGAPRRLMDTVVRDRKEEHANLTQDEWILKQYPSFAALEAWNTMVGRIALRYWPPLDFPHPYRYEGHPARPFVTASLYSDPRTLVNDADDLIEMSPLLVEPMLTSRDEREVEGWSDAALDEVSWCIPVYPGLTAKDLVDAAPAIVERVNHIFGDRTPQARILALDDQGLTQKKIAERLGMTEKNIQAVLSRYHAEPEKDSKS